MNRLLGVELTRLRRRRAVLVLLLAALIAPLVVSAIVLWSTRPVSAEDLRRAEERVAAEREQPYVQRQVERCIKRPQRYGVRASDPAAVERLCERNAAPRVEWFLDRPVLSLGEHQGFTGLMLVALVTALMMLAATTFIGHDWNSGSMSNQLLFEPRRLRVWGAKALAVVLLALLASALAMALFWGPLIAAMHLRDLPVQDGRIGDIAAAYGRACLFTALAALGAYAVTNLFRSTVFTLGLMFAVVVVGSFVVALIPLADRESLQLPTNLVAWMFGEATYYRDVPDACFIDPRGGQTPGLDCRPRGVVGMWRAAAYFGVLASLAVLPSAWSFRRRDVP